MPTPASGPENKPFTTPAPPVPSKKKSLKKLLLALSILAFGLFVIFIKKTAVLDFLENRGIIPEREKRLTAKDRYQNLLKNNRLLLQRVEQLEAENAKLVQEVGVLSPGQKEQFAQTETTLGEVLQEKVGEGGFEIFLEGREIILRFPSDAFFNSTSTYVHGKGREILATIADVLEKDLPGANIRVEGHTNNEALSTSMRSRFESQWSIAASRATSVVHNLETREEWRPENLSTAAWGSSRPLHHPRDEKNHRIEIFIFPSLNPSAH